MEHLLCAKRYSRHWDTAVNNTQKNPCLHGAYTVVGGIGTKKNKKLVTLENEKCYREI